MLLQSVQLVGSVAPVSGNAQSSCLPNFLRFCPSISTSSSGQQCPSIAFDRPYGVYPSLTSQVRVELSEPLTCLCLIPDIDRHVVHESLTARGLHLHRSVLVVLMKQNSLIKLFWPHSSLSLAKWQLLASKG